jgi:hypothetical protein
MPIPNEAKFEGEVVSCLAGNDHPKASLIIYEAKFEGKIVSAP